MRRFILSLLAIPFFITILCGCQVQQKTELQVHFTATAQITTPDITYTVTVCSSDTDITVRLLSPDTVSGLTYQRTNSTLYIDYDGLKCITQSDYLSADNPIAVLIETFFAISQSPVEYIETVDEFDIYTGTTDYGDFTLYVNTDTGYIERLVPSYADCEISFTEIKT